MSEKLLGTNSSAIAVTISIFNGADGQLIWRNDQSLKGKLEDKDEIADKISDEISGKHPYRKVK